MELQPPPTQGGGSPETFYALLGSDRLAAPGWRGRGGAQRSPSLLRDFRGRPPTRPSRVEGNGNADGL